MGGKKQLVTRGEERKGKGRGSVKGKQHVEGRGKGKNIRKKLWKEKK